MCSTRIVRLCTAIVIISVALVSASARGATVRTDGTYYRIGSDRIAHHFRFYTDRVVISAATPESDTPAKIARWFRRDGPLIAKGRYSVRRGTLRLTFHTELAALLPSEIQPKVPATHAYSGIVRTDHLVLRRERTGAEKRYDFAKAGR
jgi:hypothetical protein